MNGLSQPAESRTAHNGDFGVSQRVFEALGEELGSLFCPLKDRIGLIRHGSDVEAVLVKAKLLSLGLLDLDAAVSS